ncbi:SDR family oxidoreductase [Actinocorallia aurantiaca]|uniref:SDR family oxidoreductase n=1 Tax=Actinocorallia aurantiaca TaxID=46204 RepID=A0ABP6GSV0_9ACTN
MAVIVVTGGTRGIGHGIAKELIARGAQVVICGRSGVDEAAAELGATGVVCDMTVRAQVEALWEKAASLGPVAHWVNNAGVSTTSKPLAELPAEQLETVVNANLLGVLNGSAVAARHMLEQGSGTIWNMEGFGSDGRTMVGLTAYGSTKRAVTYVTESLAKELKGTQVKAAHLSPGMVVTDLLLKDYEPEQLEKAKKVFNILADKVETVTPFLAEGILKGVKNGGRVAWLTTPKIAFRFATAGFNKRDLFA